MPRKCGLALVDERFARNVFRGFADLRTLPLIERKDLEEAPATEALTYPLSRSC